jgi:hypothetical protein
MRFLILRAYLSFYFPDELRQIIVSLLADEPIFHEFCNHKSPSEKRVRLLTQNFSHSPYFTISLAL